jgi:hypothetical protein
MQVTISVDMNPLAASAFGEIMEATRCRQRFHSDLSTAHQNKYFDSAHALLTARHDVMQVTISVARNHPVSAVCGLSTKPKKGNSKQREVPQQLCAWLAAYAQRLKTGVFSVTTCRSLDVCRPENTDAGERHCQEYLRYIIASFVVIAS